jgi:uncharacterized protein (DUF427 family)
MSMALTFGTAPHGPHPAGQFNFESRGPDTVLYWDEFPKRVRVEFDQATIADSRAVRALHETGRLMVLYFPLADVDQSVLEPSEHTTASSAKGTATYWNVQVGDRTAENAVWAYAAPPAGAPPMAGHVAFHYSAMDAWYQEDERVYAHPRDPYHRVDVHASSRHVVVRHHDIVVAESTRPLLLFETSLPVRYYIPPEDVRTDHLRRSDTVTPCPYKGPGQHWHLTATEEQVDDMAWSLPEPLPGEPEKARDCICFYPDKVRIDVDGVRVHR